MTKQTVKHFALSLVVLGVVLTPPLSLAQARFAPKLPGKHAASSSAQAASRQAKTPDSPTYNYTLLSFPGTLYTYATGINLGATTSKIEIVGGYGPDVEDTPAGFLARVSEKKTVAETYEAVNYPHVPPQQGAESVNDLGQIVGEYLDSSGDFHGYERAGGKFSQINVPFAGATGTFPFGINNSGEVVGGWNDSDGNEHGFTLIGSTYASFDYPGSIYTNPFGLNSAGDIVGQYEDASGVGHGFLLSGGTYTSFDFPGAVETFGVGINDAGDIIGVYCLTSECISTFEGAQGFLLSGGVFTTITVPGEFYTEALGINNNGVVVGFYQDADGLVVSFLATP
jgi:hypothetical protein